uniref:Uncharacterized protein n=1 Tax=Salix viminalis TaxID=40686 RepID=A0A6N2N1V2_SALVM
MGHNGGFIWNQSKELAHLANTKAPTSDSITLRVRGFNKEEIECLTSLLNTMEKPFGSCYLAQNGKILISYVFSASNQNHSNTWVIDSGATNHMTYDANALKSYQTCHTSKKITVANGSEEENIKEKTIDFTDFDMLFFIPPRQQSSSTLQTCESPNITTLQGKAPGNRPLHIYRRRVQPELTLLQAQESEPEQKLEKEVYMDLPPGFSHSLLPNQVCRLKKTVYGLKQSPKAWFGRFTKAMILIGYRQSQRNHILFIKHSNSREVTILIVYVNDIIITKDDFMERDKLRKRLSVECKKLERLKYFLSIEVAHSEKGIFISQQKYIYYLLKELRMVDYRPCETSIDLKHRLDDDEEGATANKGQYKKLVGKLVNLAHTRPDIAYVVSVESQFILNQRIPIFRQYTDSSDT